MDCVKGDVLITVSYEGLSGLEDALRRAPAVATQAARIALNQTAERRISAQARRLMRQQVTFPVSYLTGDRFGVSSKATDSNLSVTVTARWRPTSLARFAVSKAIKRNGKGVALRVKPGRQTKIGRAFLVRLRRGQILDDENFNLGLAVRLKPGERITGRRTTGVTFADGLTLLYGPSVAQVFQTVRDEVAPAAMTYLDDEFRRQFARLSKV